MTIPELKSLRELLSKEYIDKFCKKQDLAFDGWVANIIGGMASFNDGAYHFDFLDICFDLETRQKHNAILRRISSFQKGNYCRLDIIFRGTPEQCTNFCNLKNNSHEKP